MHRPNSGGHRNEETFKSNKRNRNRNRNTGKETARNVEKYQNLESFDDETIELSSFRHFASDFGLLDFETGMRELNVLFAMVSIYFFLRIQLLKK